MSGQWSAPLHNVQQREEDWFRSGWWSHQSFCGCGDPTFHFSLLGHRAGRHWGGPGGPPPPPGPIVPPAIEGPPGAPGGPAPILPPPPPEPPEYPRPNPCRSGGEAGGGGRGHADGEPPADWDEGDIQALLDAAAEDVAG